MNKELCKHFSFRVFSDVENICCPLSDNFGCNLFLYQRNFLDNEAKTVEETAFLCNHASALEFILNLRKEKRESVKYDYNSKKRQYVFLETTQPKFANMLRQEFDFNYVLCRDEKLSTGEWEHFIIGSKSHDPNTVNKYVNSLNFFDKFAIFFRDTANKLIKGACDDKFASKRPIEKCTFQNASKIDITTPKRFHVVNAAGEFVVLTLAEMRSLILLSRGRTAKEIARLYGTSFRTIERQIQSGKLKIDCSNKGDLVTAHALSKQTHSISFERAI